MTAAIKTKVDGRVAVLVTGGAGYIGSHTCKALANAGYMPITFDNLVHGHRWAVQWGPLVEGDLADAELLKKTMAEYCVEAVLHFSGYCYVGESMSKPEKYFRNNVVNSLTLLEAMRSAGVKHIVFSSTCATYGFPVKMPISESNPQNPINPYGESKLAVEKMLRWWGAAHSLRWTTLRYFNAAGADPEGQIGEDHDPETHLMPLAIQAALGDRAQFEIYGCDYPTPDGTAIRDFIHVTDLAAAHVAALRRLEAGGESIALNLGTGSGHSVREVLAMVEQVSGRKVPAREAPRRAGDPPELVAAVTSAAQILNWRPQNSSLQNIITTAWRWHSDRHAKVAREGRTPAGMNPALAVPEITVVARNS
ncbi:MAG: UDP-glucose 4-epimerase GalE [Burkholderiales bacterium]